MDGSEFILKKIIVSVITWNIDRSQLKMRLQNLSLTQILIIQYLYLCNLILQPLISQTAILLNKLISVCNIKGLHFQVANIQRLENLSLQQELCCQVSKFNYIKKLKFLFDNMNIVVVGRYFLELGTFKFEISFKMIKALFQSYSS